MGSGAAFLSYARSDDIHSRGRVRELGERLASEASIQTGEPFEVFIDRQIQWGESWKRRIEESLNSSAFLIPVVSPAFLKSAACREELLTFRVRERALKRDDLILPVLFVDVAHDLDESPFSDVVEVIRSRQWADWRDLRLIPSNAGEFEREVASLATQLTSALRRRSVEPARWRQGAQQRQSLVTEHPVPQNESGVWTRRLRDAVISQLNSDEELRNLIREPLRIHFVALDSGTTFSIEMGEQDKFSSHIEPDFVLRASDEDWHAYCQGSGPIEKHVMTGRIKFRGSLPRLMANRKIMRAIDRAFDQRM